VKGNMVFNHVPNIIIIVGNVIVGNVILGNVILGNVQMCFISNILRGEGSFTLITLSPIRDK